jgi:hypothetical protein
MSGVRRAVDRTMIAVTSPATRSLEWVQWGAESTVPTGTDVGGSA